MKLYLVDATFELFRAYYSSPPKINDNGLNIGAVQGALRNICALVKREGITHLACATDHVIESFRNSLFDGYKSGDGLPADLLEQFIPLEKGIAAQGITLWPMKRKFEADDAIASACELYTQDFAAIVIASPDKDFYQCINNKVSVFDVIRNKRYDAGAVFEKLGVYPESIPDYLGLVGDSADVIPGLPKFGAKTAARLLSEYGRLENIPADFEQWPGQIRSKDKLAATLNSMAAEAALYKKLAILRRDVPLKESAAELALKVRPEKKWAAFCRNFGVSESITWKK